MMDQIEIRSPKTEAEWKKYDDFRWEILRKPLNIPHQFGNNYPHG
jgi:hypothetical protein